MVVELAPRAYRDLASFSPDVARGLLNEVEKLGALPWAGPPVVKKLSGQSGLFRLRVGSHRVIFEKTHERVVVLRIVDRKDLQRVLKHL